MAHEHEHEHEDDFLRQLAGGEMTATRAPASARGFLEDDAETKNAEESPASQDEPAEPVLTHRLNDPGPAQGSGQRPRRSRETQGTRHMRSRLAAVGALVFGLIVLVALVGANGNRSATGHTRTSASAQRAVSAASPARKRQGANAAPPGRGALNGTPAGDHGRLRLRWAGAPGATLRTAWRPGGAATITGRLSTMDRRPVRDAQVSVLAADANRPEQGSRTVGEVRTDNGGAFHARIALDRGAPAKLLTFTYLARARDTVPAAEGHARLDIYAAVSLKADAGTRQIRRGQAVQLVGSTVPAGAVELWAKLPGTTWWRRLANARAGRDGSWQAIVRVGRGALQGTYTFQARVAGDASYLGGHSLLTALEVP